MNTLDKVKLNIIESVNKALGKKIVEEGSLIYPPKPEFGDLSLICFGIAKEFKKSPVEMAEFLVGKVERNDFVVSIKAIGPYLNFTLNKSKLAEELIKEIAKTKNEFGRNKSGKGKKVVIEFSNANTHKEFHVGHLRNISHGDAVNRIIAANGYKAVPVSYINDFGIHVAKTLWYAFYDDEKRAKKLMEDAKTKNKGYLLGQMYAQSTKALEEDTQAKQKVSFLMKKIESRKGEEYKLWQKTRKWSIEQFDKIYKELGIKFEHIFYENEFVDKGLKLVAKLYEKHFLTKSEGAIIADLEKDNLGTLVFLRSDGTALYPVADLPLAIEKYNRYKFSKSIYVVDVRQSLYFKQLFHLLAKLGFKQEMVHLGYDFVKLPEGMLSSRTGNIITYEDLRKQAMDKAVKETKKRHRDWSEKKVNEVAGKLVNGAMKFEMLKVGADKIITFDINQALKFEGFTAAYLQYTYARINSIIKKSGAKIDLKKIKFAGLSDIKENNLSVKMAKYPNIIIAAGKNYDPSEIAKYAFELAQEFNDYYHSVPVLKAEKGVREARLAMIYSIKQIIANGLGLLGVEVVEEM